MGQLSFLRFVAAPSPGAGGFVVLDIVETGAGPRLYASTQFTGEISLWQTGADLAPLMQVAQDRGNAAGVTPDLGVVWSGTGPALLTGGGVSGDLRLLALDAAGGFDGGQSLGRIADWAGDLERSVTVDLGAGVQMVYGAKSGAAGLGWLRFEDGALVASGAVADTEDTYASDAQGLATAVVAGQRYLFSAGGADPGLTSWRIDAEGGLTPVAGLMVEEGLWIAAPTVLEAATLGDSVFLVLAAAGSGSLSVISVAADGGLRVVDHVLDDRSSRFGGVTALELVEHAGQTWVIAGGADDGISLFRMLPDGRLLAEAHLADDLLTGLTDVSALAAQSTGEGIDIYAASAVEAGLTHLHFAAETGGVLRRGTPTGGPLDGTEAADVLDGGAGPDRISAGGGDDVLIDGAGADTLTGGAGADTFVFVADGAADLVADFTPFEDRLDLSGWARLRSPAQLQMEMTEDGFSIVYGEETLRVQSADGAPIDPFVLPPEDLIATHRLAPRLYLSADVPPDGADLVGTPARDVLQAGDEGQQVLGLAGDDRLTGGAGRDWLFGGAGKDRLDGGLGTNLLEGGAGNDTYVWRSDLDRIAPEAAFSAGGGIDTVEAWGDFTLPQNIEILRLQGHEDLNGYGNSAPEVLVGNPGANILSGGWGEDRIVGKGGDDVIIGGPRPDELVGDGGRVTFVYSDITDSRAGPAARDFINGFTHGIDRIDLSLIDANSRTTDINEAFTFIGNRPFSGTWSTSAGELNYASYGGNWNIVSADVDGDGRADFQIFVNLTHWMTGTDFIL